MSDLRLGEQAVISFGPSIEAWHNPPHQEVAGKYLLVRTLSGVVMKFQFVPWAREVDGLVYVTYVPVPDVVRDFVNGADVSAVAT